VIDLTERAAHAADSTRVSAFRFETRRDDPPGGEPLVTRALRSQELWLTLTYLFLLLLLSRPYI
jgi:hypothetical protein